MATPPIPSPPFRAAPFPVTVLPQQRLLLQLIAMSGDIAVTDNVTPKSILRRTLHECAERGWVESRQISPGVQKVTLRPAGRRVAHAEDED